MGLEDTVNEEINRKDVIEIIKKPSKLTRLKNWALTHKAEIGGAYLGANYTLLNYLNFAVYTSKYFFETPTRIMILLYSGYPSFWTHAEINKIFRGNFRILAEHVPQIIKESTDTSLWKAARYLDGSTPELIALGLANTALWAGIGFGVAKLGKTIYNKIRNQRQEEI